MISISNLLLHLKIRIRNSSYLPKSLASIFNLSIDILAYWSVVFKFLSNTFLFFLFRSLYKTDKRPSIICSMTTYPARFRSVWITVESILSQKGVNFCLYLVLSKREILPSSIYFFLKLQELRGLRILFVDDNYFSHKKYLHTYKIARDLDIPLLTADDDIIYSSGWLKRLYDFHLRSNKKYVIGSRGVLVTYQSDKLLPYLNWPSISNPLTDHRVLLTGSGGILYPAVFLEALSFHLTDDLVISHLSTDDILLKHIGLKSGIKYFCLGSSGLLLGVRYFSLKHNPLPLHSINNNMGIEHESPNDISSKTLLAEFFVNS